MSEQQDYTPKIKQAVDQGASMAEAILKVFDDLPLLHHESTINTILGNYSAQDLQNGSDYFFLDGSRLNIDSQCDSMTATKGINRGNHTRH
ncbi:hypothetical protein [Candidatus Sororendozoicomonas aggregata]|uniref:hypothetical protein n=1 Tax=Candidatus Sororendozoicomonas aggregata TaxID=3073239 RepID=UPI002ED55BE4